MLNLSEAIAELGRRNPVRKVLFRLPNEDFLLLGTRYEHLLVSQPVSGGTLERFIVITCGEESKGCFPAVIDLRKSIPEVGTADPWYQLHVKEDVRPEGVLCKVRGDTCLERGKSVPGTSLCINGIIRLSDLIVWGAQSSDNLLLECQPILDRLLAS